VLPIDTVQWYASMFDIYIFLSTIHYSLVSAIVTGIINVIIATVNAGIDVASGATIDDNVMPAVI
jgi:hypothetical protein